VLQYDFQESITYWVCMTARALEKALNEELAPQGITMQQARVLGWLSLDGALTQSQLAERLQVEPSTLTGILDRMERAGWIQRETDPADRRKKIVRPAMRVQPVWARITTCGRRVRARATADVKPEDLATCRKVLARLQENLATPARGNER
jgi:MarR family transcriptional regulator for hemolysin